MPIFFPNSSPNGTAVCMASQSGCEACCLQVDGSLYTDRINFYCKNNPNIMHPGDDPIKPYCSQSVFIYHIDAEFGGAKWPSQRKRRTAFTLVKKLIYNQNAVEIGI